MTHEEAVFDISIEVSVEAEGLDVDNLYHLAEEMMTGQSVTSGTALAVLITSDTEVQLMNHQFLGINEPTDVLSFPDEADDFIQGVANEPLLGDIAIAVDTAQRQAVEHGLSFQTEVRHLLAHGILHLCGYDHVDDAEAESRMRAREEHYLGDLGAFHTH